MSDTRIVRTLTIPSGSALSDVLEDLKGYRVAALGMPDAWTAADITIQGIVQPGGTYHDVHDDGGTELNVKVDASQIIVLSRDQADNLAGLYALRLRSGTTGTSVNQAADREIEVVLVKG